MFPGKKAEVVVGEGFEPSKAKPAELQSAPFDRFGTPPFSKENGYHNRKSLVVHSDLKFSGLLGSAFFQPCNKWFPRMAKPDHGFFHIAAFRRSIKSFGRTIPDYS